MDLLCKQGPIPLLTNQKRWRLVRGTLVITLFYLQVVYLYRTQQVSLAAVTGGTVAAIPYAIKAESKRKETISVQTQTEFST